MTDSGRKLRALWLAVLLLCSVVTLASLSGTAAAAGNHATVHDSCTTITSEGLHVLEDDLTETATCFRIEASNVTLDGQGHTVDGVNGHHATRGVYVAGPQTNVTVRNLTVTNYETGIYLQEASNGTVRDVTIRNSTREAINAYASQHNTFGNLTVTDNVRGIYFSSLGTDNVVRDSTVRGNDHWAIFMDSWEGDVPTNRFENLDLGASTEPDTTLSFTGHGVVVDGVSSPPPDPTDRASAGRYLNVTAVVESAYLDLALEYEDGDVPAKEPTLALYRNDGEGWSTVAGSTVDTTENELSVNLTSIPQPPSYPPTEWTVVGAFAHAESDCRVIDSPGSYELLNDVASGDGSACVEITASDVVLDGNGHTVDAGPGGYGVQVHGTVSNVTVRNLTTANGDQGVHVGGGVSNATVADVTVRNTESRGIVLRGPDATVTGSLVENPGMRGFLVAENGDGAVVENTTVVGGGGDRAGLRVQNDATLRHVTVRNSSGHGISVVVDPTVDIVDSTVTGAGGQGIDAESGVVTIANTTVSGSSEEGIRIAGGVSIGEIRDSVVVENGGNDGGIYVSDRNVELSNVTSARNDEVGLRLGASGTTVRNGTFRNNGVYGVYVFDATGISLTDNAITDNDVAGIRLAQGSDVSLDRDRFSGNGDAAVFAADGTVAATDVVLNGTTYTFDANDVAVEPAAATPPLPRDQVGLGTALNVSAAGASPSFDGTLPYDESAAAAAAGEGAVTVWRYDGETGWSTVPTTVDEATDTASFSTNDFSTFAPLVSADLPGEEVVGCRVIDSPGRYTLAAPLVEEEADVCIEITASDVVLDGNGFSVTGGNQAGSVGVEVTSGVSNVTLRNLTVRDWATDVAALDASGVAGDGLTLSHGTTVDFDATNVALTGVSPTTAPEPPRGQIDAGRFVNLTSGGGSAAIDLTVTYDQADVSGFDEADLSMWTHDVGGWVEVGGTVDPTANTVSVTLASFSTVAPLATSNLDGEAVDSCRVIDDPGVYALNDDLTSPDGSACIEITASDVVLNGHGHTIDAGPGGEGVLVGSEPTISNVAVRNLTATGGGDGLAVENAANVTLSGVTARSVGGDGIHLRPGAWNARLTGVTVDGTGDGAQGIYVEAANATIENARSDDAHFDGYSIRAPNATLVDSTTDGVGAQGVYVTGGGDDATIRNVTVTGPADNGVRVEASGVVVADVTVRDAGSRGIWVRSGGRNATVRNASLATIREAAVRVESGATGLVVRNSTMAAAGQRGDVSVDDISTVEVFADDALFADNALSGGTEDGFRVRGAGAVFRNNTVDDPEGDGFDVASDDVSLRNNSVRSARGYGVEVHAGASGVTLHGDLLADNPEDALRTDTTISGTNVSLDGTVVTFTARDVRLSPASFTPTPADGLVRLGASFEAVARSDDAYVDVTLTYSQPGSDLIESRAHVRTWDIPERRYSGPVASTVDTGANTVSANVTDVSTVESTVAVLAPRDLPGEEVLDCRVIDEPGTYSLVGPIVNESADPCIDVQSDDVVVDGRAYSIAGGPGTTGVRVGTDGGEEYENVTLRNVTVTGHGGDALELFGGPTTLDRVSLGTATLSGSGSNVAVNGTTLPSLPADTVALRSNLTVESVGPGARLDATIPIDVPRYLDAADAAVWRDAGGWASDGGTIDTDAVSASVSATPTGGPTTYAVLADAPAATIVTDCRVVDEPGAYVLGRDLETREDTCIEIESSDVVLRGYDHSVRHFGPTADAGVLVDSAGDLENVTVRNLTVIDWRQGIRYRGVRGGTIADVNATANGRGVYVQSSSHTTVRNVTARSDAVAATGIIVRSGSNVTVTDSDVSDLDGEGVVLWSDVTDARVSDNAITGNGNGVWLVPGDAGVPSNTTLRDNVIGANDRGLVVTGATGTTSVDDTITGSPSVAVSVEDGATLDATGLAVGPAPGATRTLGFDARNVTLSVNGSAPSAGAGLARVGHVLDVTTTGSGAYLDLDVHYGPADVAEIQTATLALRRYDGGWTPVASSTLDRATGVVSANLTRNATVGAFGVPSAPALFEPTIDGTSGPVTAGETLDVTVTVTNTGDLSATRTLALRVDGIVRERTNVMLDGGQSTTVKLTWATGDDAGNYTAVVTTSTDEATSNVTVLPSDPPDSTPEPTPVPTQSPTPTRTPSPTKSPTSTASSTPGETTTSEQTTSGLSSETSTSTTVPSATGTRTTVPTGTPTRTDDSTGVATDSRIVTTVSPVGPESTAEFRDTDDTGSGPELGPLPVLLLFVVTVVSATALWYRSSSE